MTGNYDNVAGVELAEWEDGADDPTEQRHCKLDEMYHDEYRGDLVVRFEDRDTGRYFDLTIPIKADPDWNDLVGSLPVWEGGA